MTSENDFHAILDADPSDHHTRLVFADWLQDRDDSRAEGYRAMGRMWWVKPDDRSDEQSGGGWIWWQYRSFIGTDWFDLIRDGSPVQFGGDGEFGVLFLTPRRAWDAAALAFARLPLARRAALLSSACVA